jgi:NADH:ubiquinone oxidoreductase subunit 4 (subunit M)
MCTKSASCRYNVTFWNYVENGTLFVVIPIAPLAAKNTCISSSALELLGNYGSIVALRQKDLKKLLAYSSLAHVGLIAAGRLH